jgi:hypothetical protein
MGIIEQCLSKNQKGGLGSPLIFAGILLILTDVVGRYFREQFSWTQQKKNSQVENSV